MSCLSMENLKSRLQKNILILLTSIIGNLTNKENEFKTYVEKDKTKKYFEKLLKTVYSGANASIKKLDEIRYSFIKSVLKKFRCFK